MKKKIYIIGTGMGNHALLTKEAEDAIFGSDCLIGAERIILNFDEVCAEKFAAILSNDIVDLINTHNEFKQISVLMSGDVGFYSGAKKLIKLLEEYDVQCLCGISSIVYLCSKLMTSWDDVKIVSLHGRDDSISSAVMTNAKTFVLTGGDHTVADICAKLCSEGFADVKVCVGENLSCENERIVTTAAKELISSDFDSLSVMLIINEKPLVKYYDVHGLSDELFIRGEVPMTKSEVRSVSISKLQLKQFDIVYDIGAGTGSVSIEAALICTKGVVYAVEKNEAAVELIKKNSEKFGTKNLKIFCDDAPNALIDLPSPDKAFIGGSSGNMGKIIQLLKKKNPLIRIVINAIALETLNESMKAFESNGFHDVDIVQMSVAKSKNVGSYHMMMGQNPIYILSAGGGGIEIEH